MVSGNGAMPAKIDLARKEQGSHHPLRSRCPRRTTSIGASGLPSVPLGSCKTKDQLARDMPASLSTAFSPFVPHPFFRGLFCLVSSQSRN
jgi:hypothetical protein